MKNLKQSNGLKTAQNEVKTLIDLTKVSLSEVQNLSVNDQIEWFKLQKETIQHEVEAKVNEVKEKTYFFGGSNVLAMTIYKNSLNGKITDLNELWNVAQSLKNSQGETVGMTWNAFTRTFNTSVYTLAKNKKFNAENSDKPQKIETVSYFDALNKNIQDPKISENFEGLPKLEVLINTVEVPKVNSFGKNNIKSMNTFFILPFMLPTLKRYLELKGAKETDFEV